MKTKMFLWAVLGYALAGLAFWIVVSTATVPLQPLPLVGLSLIFGISSIGFFWMLFVVIRSERHPLSWILLAFIPYFAVGYYIERVRRNRTEARPGETRTGSSLSVTKGGTSTGRASSNADTDAQILAMKLRRGDVMDTRMFLWAVFGFAVAGLMSWIVTSPVTVPPQPLSVALTALLFGVSPIGSFWMLFVVIRYEKHPLPWVLLAFIPYFWVGYYFERVRRNRIEPRTGDRKTGSSPLGDEGRGQDRHASALSREP